MGARGHRLLIVLMLAGLPAMPWGGNGGSPAEYVGGTIDTLSQGEGRILVSDPLSFVFESKRATVRIPYEKINLLEYGQNVDRRILESILISPLFMLSKKRAHFLSVGYETGDGRQEAMVFRVDKKAIRAVLVSLEARTGRKVVYQDEEARKAGKG